MVKASDLFKQTWQQDDKKTKKVSDLFSTNNDKADLFTSQDNTKNIKESLKDTERTKYWLAWDIWDSVTGLFWELWDLAEYWWTVATNKNKDWWINDYKKYKEYSTKMSESKSEQEYSDYYNKMVNENVIDEQQYNRYVKDQQNDKDYKFNQAKETGKNAFSAKVEWELSSIMSQASNRYQIDAISKGISSIEDQYNMAYENVMNAYKDTRDDKILEEWEKTSKQYENDIIAVTKERANEIVKGKTYWDAYSTTIDNFATKKLANEAVNLERSMTNKLYQYTLERNFNDAWEYLSTGNLLQTTLSGLLGIKNLITWWLQQVSFWIEEAKQFATDRYDIAEELANLNVYDENASGFTKTLGWAKWVGNWVLDSLPNLAPAVAEIILTRKVPWAILKKLDTAIDWMALSSNVTRAWFRIPTRIISELAMDNLVYDEAFQVLVWHPITGEEENVNLMFNGMIDTAQAFLHVPAKLFNQALKKSDVATKRVSKDTINLAKKLEDDAKNLNLLVESYVLTRGKEITEWTKAKKIFDTTKIDLEELRKTEPELVDKILQIQNWAVAYTERMAAFAGKLDDLLLTAEDLKWRKAYKQANTVENVMDAAQETIRKSKVLKETADYLLAWAKSTSITFKEALNRWWITEQELRNSIKKFTSVKWFDDLVLWLATHNPALRDAGITKIAEEWNKLTRWDINLIYNSVIKDLVEKKWDNLIEEWEFIGKFKKKWNNQYVDIYNVMDDDKSVYTLDEVLWQISTEVNALSRQSQLKWTMWWDKFLTYDTVKDAYTQVMYEINNWLKTSDDEFDLLPSLQRIGWLNLEWWIDKTDAEKWLIKDILSKVWFVVKEEDWQLKWINWQYLSVDKLYNDIKWLGSKKIDDFGEEDIAAYKLLYFWDINDSFKSYIARNKLDKDTKFDASKFQKEFTTFFEKQFDKLSDGKYKLKTPFMWKDSMSEMYKSMFSNNASFKEIEEFAASNLIKNILDESVELWETDTTVYNKIKELVCKWHYAQWHEKEVIPVINSLFNQAKWLANMWISKEWIEKVAETFWEIVVDDKTITSLSMIGSDYLYKGIVSRLMLWKNAWPLYRDSLINLYSQIPNNAPKELIDSIKVLATDANKLIAKDISDADKQVLLNKLQSAFDVSGIKVSRDINYWSKKFAKWWVNVKNWIFNIKDASKLTDTDINNMADMLASITLFKNNLPNNWLLTKLRDWIKRALDNAKAEWTKWIQFSIWQTQSSLKNWVINLSQLSDVYLMQLMRDPDNVFQMIIGNAMLYRWVDSVEKLFNKIEWYKDVEISEDMKSLLNGLKWYIEWWFDKSNDELVSELVSIIKEKWLTNKWNLMNKLVDLRDSLVWTTISDKDSLLVNIDNSIDKIDNLINILTIPGNSNEAISMAQALYWTKQLLRRWKELLFSKKDEDSFKSELSRAFDSVERYKKFPLTTYWGILTESETAEKIWWKWTNNIIADNPLEFNWSPFKWKKFVLIDTETTWLDDAENLAKYWEPEIIQLAYRVLEVDKDWNLKEAVEKHSENYRWNRKKMSKFSLENVKKHWIKEWKTTFEEWTLMWKLKELAEDKNVYFVWHNLWFDNRRLKKWWISISDDRLIDTSELSNVLIPVTKNHKQETLTQVLWPINSAIETLKLNEWVEWSHHDARIDTLELQAVFPYLMNHALKNGKTTEAWLLKFMRDVTKDMWKEKDSGKITPNATPFYKLEYNWSNMHKGTKQWFMDNSSDDRVLKIWELLNQMFWTMKSRRQIDEVYEEIKNVAKTNPSKVLNIHDVITSISDKLWDPKAVYVLNELKNIVDANAVIDINKVLMWEEVKDAFLKARNAWINITFWEYCTNRLVANILSTIGNYNEGTIKSINELVSNNIETASLSKLMDGKSGSLDVEPIMSFIDGLNDSGLLNLWEKWSTEYHNSIREILWKLEDVWTTEDIAGVAVDDKWESLIKLVEDWTSFKLREFNKALYTYLEDTTNEEAKKWLAIKFNDIFDELFWLPDKYWEGAWYFKEKNPWRQFVQLIGDKTWWRNADLWMKAPTKKELRKELESINKKLEIAEWKLNYWLAVEEQANKLSKEWNKEEAARLRKLFKEAPDATNEIESLKEEKQVIEARLSWETILSEDSLVKEVEWWKVSDDATLSEESYEAWVLEQKPFDREEDIVAEVQNDYLEWAQSKADTVNAYGDNMKSTEDMFYQLLDNDKFMEDNVLKKDTLSYNNLFLIDETKDSTSDYIKSSYNGILSTLALGNAKNKDRLINYLWDKINSIEKQIDELEVKYNSIKKPIEEKLRVDETWKMVKTWKELETKESKEIMEQARKLNTTKSYLYNMYNVLRWARTSTTPQQLTNLNWFNENLIGKWTYNWEITWIDIAIKWPKNQELFNEQLFNWRELDRLNFVNQYLMAIYEKAQWTGPIGKINVIYKTKNANWVDWEVIDVIDWDKLFDTKVWDYILKQFWLWTNTINYTWADKTLAALDLIKKSVDGMPGNPERWQTFRMWHLSWAEWPWRDWTEDDWIEWLSFINEPYIYYRHLSEEGQAKYLEAVKEFLWKNWERKAWDQWNEEDAVREFIKRKWPLSKLDNIVQEDTKYDSAAELMYKEVIKPLLDKEWSTSETIKDIMTEPIKSPLYKANVDARYWKWTTSYYIDTYMSLVAPQYMFESNFEKKLSYEVRDGDKYFKVVGIGQKFYEVEDELDFEAHWNFLWNTAPIEAKWLRWEPLPNPRAMWRTVVRMVDTADEGKFVYDAESRNQALRDMEPTEPRNIFEYVYDDPETKVKLEDENWNLYVGTLVVEPWSRNIVDWHPNWEAGKFQLTDVRPYDSEEFTTKMNEGKWISSDWYLREWEKTKAWEWEWWEIPQKKNSITEERELYSKSPEDTKIVEKKKIENTEKDWDEIDSNMEDIIPSMKREWEIWNTRLLNFTNYDLYNKSDVIQQIAGKRLRFLSESGKELREAIDKFNKTIEWLSDDEQTKVYQLINARARKVIAWNKDAQIWKQTQSLVADMLVDWLSKETQDALYDIWYIFKNAWWDPEYQFAMLSKRNDGFEWILKNLAHNHKWAAADYFKAVWENLRQAVTTEVKNYFTWEKEIKNAVEDMLWDPLWVSSMFKMATWVRSLWRFIKYWPIVFPLSWVLMLANSAVLWITRYWSESSGFRWIMNNPAFDILIAKKWDLIKLPNGKEYIWLGFADWINRVNEIMFNSNSDLWWSWFDKCLDWMLNKIPENNWYMKRTKEILTTAMKWWTHSLFDLFAQSSVKSMELAKSLEKNLSWLMSLDEFVVRLQNWSVDAELVNRILWDMEKWYSRFFTNSATSLFSRHKFSRLYIFNALQWYVINRTDEVFSSIKDCINWIGRQQTLYNRNGWKWIAFNWKDFVNYINTDNQELKWLLMNVLLSAKLWFYMDRLVNWWDFSGKEYSDYMIDTSDYLSSLPATFFYGILTAPVAWIEDYAEYVKMNNEDFNIWDWLTVAWVNTVSQLMSKFFREGKVLSAFMDSIVSYWKTWDINFAYDVLEWELASIANWLGRFQLVEWTNKYWLDNLTSERDMLGQILFNADKVSESGKLTNDLYSLQTVDSILNWEDWDYWKNRLLPYIPLIWNILQNSITGTWYTFTSAKWKELQHIMDKDEVVQILNNWDYDKMQDYQWLWWDEWIYTDEAVWRMYKELTAFNYPYKWRKNGTDFKTGYEWELEQIKETVFTDELMRWLWWTEEDLTNYLNQAPDRKKAWLMKIMAASEAARPGSSKIVLSYLANQEEYELLKKVTGKDYPSSTDVTDEEMAMIQRQVLQDYYPYMFTADKTSWYRAITEYVSNKYDLFKDLYKDDDLTWYLSTLGYMDMIMYQQAKTGNVNAKYIKNSWSMLAKYMKSEPARMNAISYIMNTINNSNFSRGKATSAKMWVLAANMDFYDKIQKNWMMQALYWEDIENYNNFVWWVLKDLWDIDWSDGSRKSSWKGYKKWYNNYNPIGDNNTPTAQQFIPRAQKYLNWRTPSFWGKSGYNPNSTYKPWKTLDWYRKYYEGLISTYSDRLVKSKGKKYPAQTVEGITFKTGNSNKWKIKWDELRFKKHKSKKYRTNVISSLPGSHW